MKNNSIGRGLVHLYVGDGKGKTTAAMGLAIRAAGAGKSVLVVQFLKGRTSGEHASLQKLGIQLMRVKECDKFTFQMTHEEFEQNKQLHLDMMALATKAIANGDVDVVVLDEVVDAVNAGVIAVDELIAAVENRADQVEVVLTGRNPPVQIESIADYYTFFQCVKHPFQSGVAARAGIEH